MTANSKPTSTKLSWPRRHIIHCYTCTIIPYSKIEHEDRFSSKAHRLEVVRREEKTLRHPLPFVCQPQPWHRWRALTPKSLWRQEREPFASAYACFNLCRTVQQPTAIQQSATGTGSAGDLHRTRGRLFLFYILHICLSFGAPSSFSASLSLFRGEGQDEDLEERGRNLFSLVKIKGRYNLRCTHIPMYKHTHRRMVKAIQADRRPPGSSKETVEPFFAHHSSTSQGEQEGQESCPC